MKPRISILSKAFKYVPEAESNIRLTFARERRRIKLEKAAEAERNATVTQLKRKNA